MKTAVKLILFYLLYQLICGLVLQNGGPLLAKLIGTDETLFAPYYTGILMISAGLLMAGHLFHFHYVDFNSNELTAQSSKSILISLPFILSSLIIVNLGSEWIPLPNWMEDTFVNMSHNGFGLASMAIMAPIIEELLFRDAIQGNFLREGISPKKAIFLSALLFGLIHANPAQIPFAFCIGLVFGWIYYRTGNLLPCITGHIINNSVSAICMAFLPTEVLETPLSVSWGIIPTLILFIASIIGCYIGYLYVNKRYPLSKM